MKDVALLNEELPKERALGVHWNVEKDQVCFKLNLKAGNITRRVMLSTLSSFYGPLGLTSPFILIGWKILQDLCQEGLQWDKTVSEMYSKKWECWKNELIELEKIELKRCIKPEGFGKIVHISLHSFSDAFELGCGESSYLRLVDEYGHIHCTFVANRVQAIQEFINANQWSYIPSEDNPADDASRGMAYKNFSNITKWFQRPAFS